MGSSETQSKGTNSERIREYVFGEHEHTTEPHHEPDALHREVQTAGTDRGSAATRVGDKDDAKPFETFEKNYKALVELRLQGVTNPEDPRVKEMIAKTDEAFQKAWPDLQKNGDAASTAIVGQPAKMEYVQQQRAELDRDLKAAGFPNGAAMKGDELSNAILNNDNAGLVSKLTHVETLNELEQLTVNSTAQNMADKVTPIKAALQYAEFLDTWKGGTSAPPADAPAGTQPVRSLDVLMAVNSPEMQAMGGRDALTRAGDQQAANANQVIPAEQNPLTYLQAAIQAQNPADALTNAQKAAELAKNINPEDCQKKVAELQTQLQAANGDGVKQQQLSQQIAAWQGLEHASGLSNTVLGRVMMSQNPPDLEGARKALLTAAGDPVGANMMLGQDGQPMYNQLLMVALTKGDTSIVQKIQDAGVNFQKAQQLAEQAGQEKDDGKKKQLLDQATQLGGQVIEQSKLLKDTFANGQTAKDMQTELDKLNADAKKNPDGKPTKDQQDKIDFLTQIQQLGNMQAQAIAATASWDMAKNDGHAAQGLLSQLNEKDHPEFFAGKDDAFKNQVKGMQDSANSMAEDNDIDGKAWYNPMKYVDKAWKFCKDNAKWIAFGVAVVGAAAVTIATAGAGAPIGAAIIGGAAAGFLGGAVVGGGLEYASGRAKSFGEGMWNVAPYAAAGGAAGALGAYYFAPAGLAAMGMSVAPEAATSLGVASGFWGTMGAGAVTGLTSGALWNAGEVRDGYRVGKYDNWKEAALDWGTGTASWGVNGALIGGSMFSLAGKGIVGLAEAKGVTWALAKPVAQLGGAAVLGYTALKTIEEGHMLGNLGYVMATHDMPRFVGQQLGMSRAQIDAANAAEQQKRNGGAPVVVDGGQAQTTTGGGADTNTGDGNQRKEEKPLPPIQANPDYKPGGSSYDDYINK